MIAYRPVLANVPQAPPPGGLFFRKLVREDTELVNLWCFGEEIAAPRFLHQGRGHLAVEMRVAPSLVIERIEDGEGRGPPPEWRTKRSFPLQRPPRVKRSARKSATSFSLLGCASNGTYSANFVIIFSRFRGRCRIECAPPRRDPENSGGTLVLQYLHPTLFVLALQCTIF